MPAKLSPTMTAALRFYAEDGDASITRGPTTGTRAALVGRGLITPAVRSEEHTLTAAGRDAFIAAEVDRLGYADAAHYLAAPGRAEQLGAAFAAYFANPPAVPLAAVRDVVTAVIDRPAAALAAHRHRAEETPARGCSCGEADHGTPGHDGGPDLPTRPTRRERRARTRRTDRRPLTRAELVTAMRVRIAVA